MLWVSVLASTLGDSPSRLAPNSSLTMEFRESPFEPFCEIKMIIIVRNVMRNLIFQPLVHTKPVKKTNFLCFPFGPAVTIR